MRFRGLIIFLSFLVISLPYASKAQTTPYTLLTWRAITYTPGYYPNKALPIAGSKIVAAIDVINGNKPVDLSKQTIYWYLSDRFITGGLGITRLAITVPDSNLKNLEVRAVLPNYGEGLAKTITIPVSEPRAVIESPLANNRIRSLNFTLKAWPYFFNIQDPSELNYEWLVDGRAPSSKDPQKIQVEIGNSTIAGTIIPISLRINNPGKSFEFSRVQTNYTFEQ